MSFNQVPKPKTNLGYHRILSPSAGLRVSPLCLGAMNFGDAWKGFMGECNKETTFSILDHFYENGGNFIDTANNYQNEESEKWIGEWMEDRGVRDEMVIATKVGLLSKTCFQSILTCDVVYHELPLARFSEFKDNQEQLHW
jgi:aryl-alcohol dehydrogenase-like predicted oxidoreductase